MIRWAGWKAAVLLILLVAVAFLLGGGWYFSNLLLKGALEPRRENLRSILKVVALDGDSITLQVTSEGGEDRSWNKDGIWGLRWEDGYARVGDILQIDDSKVVRKFFPLKGEPEVGGLVRLYLFAFPDNPEEAFGLPTQKVSFSSTLGSFPAWFIEGSRTTWVIFVHGKRDAPPRQS
ncbi:hypothetical protein MYX78_09495 [Acidobacteria bacterium AH-259-G07]|nr:hypothetical protein [Acidobacteria bacterium AH-259-G07]